MSGTSHRITLAACALACAFWLGACAWMESSSEPVEGTIGGAGGLDDRDRREDRPRHAPRHAARRGRQGRDGDGLRSREEPAAGEGRRSVNVAFYESLVYEVKKPGEAQPGVSTLDTAATAKPGEKPAAMAGEAVTVTSTIEAIDHDTPAVTLKGPEGNLVTVKVRDRAKLARVEVGDLVEITYTRAMAGAGSSRRRSRPPRRGRSFPRFPHRVRRLAEEHGHRAHQRPTRSTCGQEARLRQVSPVSSSRRVPSRSVIARTSRTSPVSTRTRPTQRSVASRPTKRASTPGSPPR